MYIPVIICYSGIKSERLQNVTMSMPEFQRFIDFDYEWFLNRFDMQDAFVKRVRY